MLVYGVEGDRNAATLVKDSKSYIEIAKFVQAYTTIVQNPNDFLSEIGEEPIDTKTDILSWKQLVTIMTQCDLGFDPVPTEKQLVSYYSYAKQIGSIKNENKVIASVSDVAEAQKHYYNFIDAETEKANVMYNKQHQIAQNRLKESERIDANLKKMEMKKSLYFALMMLSVFSVGFGFVSIFFSNPIATFVGFSSNLIGSFIFIIIGLVGFYYADKTFITAKKDYFGYKKSSMSAISRTERTCRDEKVLRDKLARYQEDLKIAKYELADKDKRFDVERNIERLRERNKFYRMFRERDGLGVDGYEKHKMSLLDELSQSGKFGKDGLFSLFGDDKPHRRHNRMRGEGFPTLEENENMRGFRARGIINERAGVDKGNFISRAGRSLEDRLGNVIRFTREDTTDVMRSGQSRWGSELIHRGSRHNSRGDRNLSLGNGSGNLRYGGDSVIADIGNRMNQQQMRETAKERTINTVSESLKTGNFAALNEVDLTSVSNTDVFQAISGSRETSFTATSDKTTTSAPIVEKINEKQRQRQEQAVTTQNESENARKEEEARQAREMYKKTLQSQGVQLGE